MSFKKAVVNFQGEIAITDDLSFLVTFEDGKITIDIPPEIGSMEVLRVLIPRIGSAMDFGTKVEMQTEKPDDPAPEPEPEPAPEPKPEPEPAPEPPKVEKSDKEAAMEEALRGAKKMSDAVEAVYSQGVKDPEKIQKTLEHFKDDVPVLKKAGTISVERIERIVGFLSDDAEEAGGI